MSKNYLTRQIEIALKRADDDPRRASDLLMRMAETDDLLYAGLTSPFIQSAAAFAIQRHMSVVRNQNRQTRMNSTKKASTISDADLDSLMSQMANSDTGAASGKRTHRASRAPKPSSSKHAQALHDIASAFGNSPKSKKDTF